jgi:dipeptidyl aminopeptidase/acylaminoacyl peptidase
VRDAYAWIRTDGPKLFGADVNRIGVTGGSAGGYLTLLCGAKLRPAPKVIVSYYGYGDITGDWYAKPDVFYNKQPAVPREEAWASVGKDAVSEPAAKNSRGRFYLFTRQQGLWPELVGGSRNLDDYCPVKHVTKQYPPTMLLHGDADTDVPVEQSKQMAAELKRVGVEHELIIMPGAPHGFDRAMDNPTINAAFEKSLAYFNRFLRR